MLPLVTCLPFLFLCIHCQIQDPPCLFLLFYQLINFTSFLRSYMNLFQLLLPQETTLELKEYRNCPIIVLYRVAYANLIELTMLDFGIILDMDCLHKCYSTIDCRNRVIRFQFLIIQSWNGNGVIQIQQAKQFPILNPIRCYLRGTYITQSQSMTQNMTFLSQTLCPQ